jgi:hypothetical protein
MQKYSVWKEGTNARDACNKKKVIILTKANSPVYSMKENGEDGTD